MMVLRITNFVIGTLIFISSVFASAILIPPTASILEAIFVGAFFGLTGGTVSGHLVFKAINP